MAARTRPPPIRLAARRTGRLHDPVQNASAAAVDDSHTMLLGGLTSADTSTDAVRVVSPQSDSGAGTLPTAVHDSAAAALAGSVYLFGVGTGSTQLDDIVRFGRASTSLTVGHLPSPSSDHAAATINGTVYVVDGYTGTDCLDTIVAYRPGVARMSWLISPLLSATQRSQQPPAI
ncbi:MAG: hypothetical protein ABI896_03045 [Actinomycetota bacterium]